MNFSRPLSQLASHQLAFILLCLIFALSLSTCANKKKDDVESERALYEDAEKYMDRSQYDLAIEAFRKIELRYPFGRYAEQAQLESIYAYYRNMEYAAANISANRFIRQYPEHPNLDYVYYLKALSNYHIDGSWVDRFVERGSVKRDLSAAKEAFRDFNELIQLYPDSDYAADAQQHMLYIKDLVAQQEIEIANYYMQRAAYVAALNRAKAVIENYPGTLASADALALQVHAYHEMGMNELASDSLKVLKHNFPKYEKLLPDGGLAPYDKLYEDNVNWLNFISFGYLNQKESIQTINVDSSPSATKPSEEVPRPQGLTEDEKTLQ